MAAPPAKTLKDLSGVWVMNKTLSDDTDRILQMQGVGWWLRKAIALATVTLTIKQYVSADGLTHIDIEQRATGGISGTTEKRTLDWAYRDHKDGIFGAVKGKSRWVKLADVEDDNEFLKKGWLEEGDEHVQSYVESVGNGWTADQIWGFEEIGGVRYHVRHVVVRKGDDWKEARLVYDYQK
ncbi:MAG: hypothetical protein FRX48_00735 [Lasallia pustulata]|uniref:LCCL domain-containing protein n=1 Tax=Lasallia pustulata TaxID=136370 RepID=A0A5M8Q1H7_9LECA|nr:MAG: hypothetical protein FRX48_00735 [Lasallia pustulata]